MIEAGVVGFLLLLLIFLVVRSQALQMEVKQFRYNMKSGQKQNKFTMKSIQNVALELQKSLLTRLDKAKKHGLIDEVQHAQANAILSNYEYVITQVCEHGQSIEQAIAVSCDGSAYSMEQVTEFIASQGSEVKVPWSKNSVAGYTNACQNLSATGLRTRAKASGSNLGQQQAMAS